MGAALQDSNQTGLLKSANVRRAVPVATIPSVNAGSQRPAGPLPPNTLWEDPFSGALVVLVIGRVIPNGYLAAAGIVHQSVDRTAKSHSFIWNKRALTTSWVVI
jgi:hypothetical protein